MKTAGLIISASLILWTGCASVERVGLEENDQWLPEARVDLLGKECTVTTRDGRDYDGKIIALDADSLRLKSESARSSMAFALERVQSIRPSRNVGAALGGVLGGALLGAAIGGAIGAKEGVPGGPEDPTGVTQAMFGLPYGAMIGAAVGTVAGGMVVGLGTAVTDYEIIYSPRRKTAAQAKPATPESTGTASDSTRNKSDMHQ